MILSFKKKHNSRTSLRSFLTPLQADIVLQWKKTKNHTEEDGTLYCRSRGSCSVKCHRWLNRTEEEVSYLWVFPDGSVSDMKNPPSFKAEFGRSVVILAATDNSTGEMVADTLTIRHTPIPKNRTHLHHRSMPLTSKKYHKMWAGESLWVT